MAKIVFLNVPGHGHVNPSLPVVAELRRRGHTIIYYNTEAFRAQIERTGAEFRPYPGPNLTAADISEQARNLVQFTLTLLSESYRLLPFVIDELKGEKPDVVINDSICLWGQQGAHLLKLPSISSITTLVMEGVSGQLTWRDWLSFARGALPRLPRLLILRRRLVREYGPEVFPNDYIFPATGALNVVYTSRRFQPATPFIDDTFRFVGPALDPSLRNSVSFPFHRLSGSSVVYVSLGTVYQTNRDFYRTSFESFENHPALFVLSVGRQTDPSALGPIPDNFIVQQVVPQLELLPSTDLFVTHGGINSVHEGLYYDVPLVVVPQQFEQLLNGRQVTRHGAGVLVGDTPPYGRVSSGELREAVETVLKDANYQSAAALIGQTLREAGGYRRAADEIENFIAAHKNRQLHD